MITFLLECLTSTIPHVSLSLWCMVCLCVFCVRCTLYTIRDGSIPKLEPGVWATRSLFATRIHGAQHQMTCALNSGHSNACSTIIQQWYYIYIYFIRRRWYHNRTSSLVHIHHICVCVSCAENKLFWYRTMHGAWCLINIAIRHDI